MGIPVENPNPEQPDNSDLPPVQEGAAVESTFTWKDKLNPDLRNSPTMQKFSDTPEGLGKATESYLSLEKLLGHEKVPIPKGPDDTDGWNRFSKAMGVPDKADAYGLADAQIPEGMKNMAFSKQQFAEVVHAHKLTPGQAKGLWEAYTKMSMDAYSKYTTDYQKNMTEVVNRLKGEWGDTYDTNVELGQMVINKFSDDKETEDFLTSSLAKDPKGIKFLAKLGAQFAENKIGEFSMKKFSLTPDDAQNEIDKTIRDPRHPYNDEKATPAEHQRAVDRVNSLYAIIQRARQG